jgi:hypothetical protein
MTNDTSKTPEELFQEMSLSKVLVAIMETIKEIKIPVLTFLDSANEDKELEVEYNSDEQTFVFKLKEKNAANE